MKKLHFSTLLILSLSTLFCIGQQKVDQINFDFIWKETVEFGLQKDKMQKTISFEGAQYDFSVSDLPFLYEEVQAPGSVEVIAAEIVNAQYESMLQAELEIIDHGKIPSEIQLSFENAIVRKKNISFIKLYPIRKNPTSGEIEKLISVELKLQFAKKANVLNKSNSYASNSVLKEGSWFKIGVLEDNVYSLSYHFLKNIGMDVDNIDPNNFRIYGNGGGKLPELNSEPRADDLLENAIQVLGAEDGRFDPSDKIIFYAEGPVEWQYDSINKVYKHYNHQYSDTNFYFITADMGAGKRISERNSGDNLIASETINTFLDYKSFEQDKVNLIKSGYEWVGDNYDQKTSYKYSFNFPNILLDSSAWFRFYGVARSDVSSKFDIKVSGQSFYSTASPTVITNYIADFGKTAVSDFWFQPHSDLLEMQVTYNKPLHTSVGWLNYIELNAWRQLAFSGDQMHFRNRYASDPTEIYEYVIKNANSELVIWDVSDPQNVVSQDFQIQNQNNVTFKLKGSKLNEFVAFGKADSSVVPLGLVPNQNLHASGPIDMAIVSHPKFMSQALQLGELHRGEGLRVVVVSPQQIYNEFSSGTQDPVAIRTFMKMFYDRALDPTDIPSYLLLFGDASYDFKNKLSGNTNYVISYESKEYLRPLYSYVSDDFFGFLDDSEGLWKNGGSDKLDIGIGRLTVQTVQQAQDMVNKIIRYSSPQSMGDWRNELVFVGDDEDSFMHANQANSLVKNIQVDNNDYNITKLFLDAFQQQTTPGGQRYPHVNQTINQKVEKGALLVNYTGHGGETGWAHERVLTINDITNWENTNQLPLFVTATCELSRYDDPNRTSAGELILLNPNGGGIGLMTTTRAAFAVPNFLLSLSLYENFFERENGKPLAMGEIYRRVKVAKYNDPNARNFSYLGDPAIRIAFPEHNVITTSINGKAIGQMDTLKALSKVTVKGYLADYLTGQKLQAFNGIIYPTVFDKERSVSTLNNDGDGVYTYNIRDSRIFNGKASVKNGEFSFTFVVPKDISYEMGKGKISYYAENSQIDANGYTTEVIIGGSSDSLIADGEGPEIEIFLNSEDFVYGGMTNETPLLLVNLSDEQGINTVGNGIGHDITMVVDGNTENSLTLNEYYVAEIDNYQRGKIEYKMPELTEGKHTLSIKAWDVTNKSSESTIEFIVVKEKDIEIDRVLNYPNPFTSNTEFWFEHNQPGIPLDVKVQIFTVSGKLVKSIEQLVVSDGFRVDNIKWDGLDDYGEKIGRGVYLYKLKVRSRNGTMAEKIEKLVIL